MSSPPSISTQPAARPAPTRPIMQPDRATRRMTLSPHQLTDRVTAADDVFLLAHLGVPRIDPAQWSLAIDGMVGRPVALNLQDLKALPKRTVQAVHQCCGSPLEPTVPTRRYANVVWGGVDLAEVLEEVKIDPHARFLWSYGLDGGEFAGTSCDWFVKDVPLQRLAAGGVLLAYEMNGAPFTAEHGFPVRLVVPGYYSTNSVKWLWRLHLAERRADGPFTTKFYNDRLSAEDVAAGHPAQRPVWALAPESTIVAPAPDTVVSLGEPVDIWGWAWSFRGIDALEITADGGLTYVRARLERRNGWAWQRFSLTWHPARRGDALLGSRALEHGGAVQPVDGARNSVRNVRVAVR